MQRRFASLHRLLETERAREANPVDNIAGVSGLGQHPPSTPPWPSLPTTCKHNGQIKTGEGPRLWVGCNSDTAATHARAATAPCRGLSFRGSTPRFPLRPFLYGQASVIWARKAAGRTAGNRPGRRPITAARAQPRAGQSQNCKALTPAWGPQIQPRSGPQNLAGLALVSFRSAAATTEPA